MNFRRIILLAFILISSPVYCDKDFAESQLGHWKEHIDEFEDPKQQSYVLSQIGNDYLEKSDFASAKEAYEKAKEIRVASKQYGLVLSSTIQIAGVYIFEGNVEEAIRVLEEGAHYEIGLDDDISRLNYYTLLCSLHLQKDRFEIAIKSAEMATDGFRSRGIWEKESSVLRMQSIAFAALDRKLEAADVLKRSFKLYWNRSIDYDDEQLRQVAQERLNFAASLNIDTSDWVEEGN